MSYGRYYMVCELLDHGVCSGCCNYFAWYDPEMCERSKNIIPGLLRKIRSLEEELRDGATKPRIPTQNNITLVARTCRRHYSNGGSKPHNSFASAAQVEEASRIFRTFVQALDLRHDKAMHAKLVKQAHISSLYLRNNLINMYAKCSHLPDALKLFDEMTHKNVVSWTAVIAGFVQKGHPVEALSLSMFRRMHVSGTKPNEFSFVSKLHACSFSKNPAHAYQTYASILRFGF
ncbi:hypothetical protein RJ640_022695 [Escallonia rubra]|uniref:Pentatricopeptide repeat-containing protein n=1 Tax=Escallonia rubra TaxID=112253 RepID=A0AA88RCP6_9ASTE|nr:hypothetical protein RJ640_022695 [Escallonia rubra]